MLLLHFSVVGIAMKPLFVSKGSTNKYYPYIIPLNERDYHEVVEGDASKEEEEESTYKVPLPPIVVDGTNVVLDGDT